MKKILLIIILFTIVSCDKYNPNKFYVGEKFVVVEKGDYNGKYFFIRKLEKPDTMHYTIILGKDTVHTKVSIPKWDTLFTALNSQNFMYNKNPKWDQLYFSFDVGDTMILKSIKKDKFWNKIRRYE